MYSGFTVSSIECLQQHVESLAKENMRNALKDDLTALFMRETMQTNGSKDFNGLVTAPYDIIIPIVT